MIKLVAGLALLGMGSVASAASTDFGIRAVGGKIIVAPVASGGAESGGSVVPRNARTDIGSAAGIGAQWGRVTSTYRSPAHNRRVGGVRNSYHLSGRAIDIARRPGVSHWQIAAAFRNAGYHLIESLDEGDHSHFAFGTPGSYARVRHATPLGNVKVATKAQRVSETQWRVVFAPSGRSR